MLDNIKNKAAKKYIMNNLYVFITEDENSIDKYTGKVIGFDIVEGGNTIEEVFTNINGSFNRINFTSIVTKNNEFKEIRTQAEVLAFDMDDERIHPLKINLSDDTADRIYEAIFGDHKNTPFKINRKIYKQ